MSPTSTPHPLRSRGPVTASRRLLRPKTRVPNLSTTDIWDHSCEDCPVCCRMSSRNPGLSQLDARRVHAQTHGCLQTLPCVPKGAKLALMKKHCSNKKEGDPVPHKYCRTRIIYQ